MLSDDCEVRGAVQCGTRRKRALEQRHGRFVEPKARIDRAHRVHQRGLDFGLIFELELDARGALIENLARRDRVAERLARVRDAEQSPP